MTSKQRDLLIYFACDILPIGFDSRYMVRGRAWAERKGYVAYSDDTRKYYTTTAGLNAMKNDRRKYR